jgi:hypothetical protein
MVDNMRIGAGYNITGFADNDLDPESHYAQGAYVGLQIKADEALFNWLTDDADRKCRSLTTVEREQLYRDNKPLPEGCDDNNNKRVTDDEKASTEKP